MPDFEVSLWDDRGNRDFTVILREQFDRHEAMRKAADRIERESGATLRVNGCREVAAIARYLREFPNYKPAEMPAIPDGFEDTSWHNDACPCFVSDPLGLELWVDYADPAEREFPERKRFTVLQQRDGVEASGPSLETDDWNEILAFVALQRQRMAES